MSEVSKIPILAKIKMFGFSPAANSVS